MRKCSDCHTHHYLCNCEDLAEGEKGHLFNGECECEVCQDVDVDCCYTHPQRWFELNMEKGEKLDAWLKEHRFRKVGEEAYCFIPIMYYDEKNQRMIYRRAHSELPLIEINDDY